MPALDRSTGRRHEREMVLLAVLLVSIIVGTVHSDNNDLNPNATSTKHSLVSIATTGLSTTTGRLLTSRSPLIHSSDISGNLSENVQSFHGIFRRVIRNHTENSKAANESWTNDTQSSNTQHPWSNILLYALPGVILILLGLALGLLVSCCKGRAKTKEYEKELEPLRGDDMDADKPDSPKFEDDIPSVLELEMEDLEKWMNTPQKE
ncbi:transmembrane protein 154 isoform X2 [Erpetoichthys calabaricus]|nr:transmembrane protein 154 isoform X2 [Erpetoichthys calabaricus]